MTETEEQAFLREVKVTRARINQSMVDAQNAIDRIDRVQETGEVAQKPRNTRGIYLTYEETKFEEEKKVEAPGKLSAEEIAKIMASVSQTTASLNSTLEETKQVQKVVKGYKNVHASLENRHGTFQDVFSGCSEPKIVGKHGEVASDLFSEIRSTDQVKKPSLVKKAASNKRRAK